MYNEFVYPVFSEVSLHGSTVINDSVPIPCMLIHIKRVIHCLVPSRLPGTIQT